MMSSILVLLLLKNLRGENNVKSHNDLMNSGSRDPYGSSHSNVSSTLGSHSESSGSHSTNQSDNETDHLSSQSSIEDENGVIEDKSTIINIFNKQIEHLFQ